MEQFCKVNTQELRQWSQGRCTDSLQLQGDELKLEREEWREGARNQRKEKEERKENREREGGRKINKFTRNNGSVLGPLKD